jgi:hypothetical protein
MLLNGDQLHLTTPHRLAMAPNFTRCSRARISQCGATNWNLGTASYAMISNSVNLVTFETRKSTRPSPWKSRLRRTFPRGGKPLAS